MGLITQAQAADRLHNSAVWQAAHPTSRLGDTDLRLLEYAETVVELYQRIADLEAARDEEVEIAPWEER